MITLREVGSVFGELLAAILPADLDVTFSGVSCPGRIVAVVIANTGTVDERYALRVDGKVQRTELVPAGTTVISRVRLPEDRTTALAVHTAGESAGSARRTADCSTATAFPPPAKGGAPGAGRETASASLEPRAETASPAPPASERGVPAPKGGTPGVRTGSAVAGERAPGRSASGNGSVKREPKKAAKRKKKNVSAGARWRREQPQTLPMTGISPALAFTAAGTAASGGILTWYGLLWPRRRHPAFPSRQRS
ncbi:hypothetical protein [Actinocorallia aurantiaca]|uniref:hypothetical protein n=1 Tax=Actinocorallia aurantiaca TaxID=46204 RepID=UPI0031DAFB6B